MKYSEHVKRHQRILVKILEFMILLNQDFLLNGHFFLVISLDGVNPENFEGNLAKGLYNKCTEYL